MLSLTSREHLQEDISADCHNGALSTRTLWQLLPYSISLVFCLFFPSIFLSPCVVLFLSCSPSNWVWPRWISRWGMTTASQGEFGGRCLMRLLAYPGGRWEWTCGPGVRGEGMGASHWRPLLPASPSSYASSHFSSICREYKYSILIACLNFLASHTVHIFCIPETKQTNGSPGTIIVPIHSRSHQCCCRKPTVPEREAVSVLPHLPPKKAETFFGQRRPSLTRPILFPAGSSQQRPDTLGASHIVYLRGSALLQATVSPHSSTGCIVAEQCLLLAWMVNMLYPWRVYRVEGFHRNISTVHLIFDIW